MTKTTKWHLRPAKTQISLGIRPVWSESSLLRCSSCGQRRLWSDWADAQADLSLHWAHSHFVGFVMRRLNYIINQDFFNLKGYWYYSFGLIFSFLIRQFFMVRNCLFCLLYVMIWEPEHSKTNKPVRPSKTQISVSYQSSPCTLWVTKDPNFLQVDREDWSTGQMPGLSLRRVQRSFCWFCCAGAHIWWDFNQKSFQFLPSIQQLWKIFLQKKEVRTIRIL